MISGFLIGLAVGFLSTLAGALWGVHAAYKKRQKELENSDDYLYRMR